MSATLSTRLLGEVTKRLGELAARADRGELDAAVDLLVNAIAAGGVVQAFGTGHSEAFAMEIAGRAGGLIPTNRIALRDVVLFGDREVDVLSGSALERSRDTVDELFEVSPIGDDDVFIVTSNSGVNGSVVGLALKARETGHKVIGVTSMEHTMQVEPKHPSGKRLCEIADVVIDNLAPYGDAALELRDGIALGAVSSITGAFIAQQLTMGVAERLGADGTIPPLYISANIPGGDEHNTALEGRYADKIRRTA